MKQKPLKLYKMNAKSLITPLGTWKFWKDLLIMTFAMILASAAVYYFVVPANLVLGSTAGLAIVISNLFVAAGIPLKVSTVILLLNIILLLLAWILCGSEFGAKTIYTSIILGPMMDLWELVLPYQKLIPPGETSVMGDIWFDLLCFVMIVSISQTILFHINASSGGLDIVAKIINKYFHTDIGQAVTVSGIVICLTAFAINPFRLVVIGIIGTWINGLAVDYFTTIINRRKRVCIVSEEHEKIRDYIINTLKRGCSLYEMIGGYNGKKNIEIEAMLTKDEFANVMNFMKENDIHSFVTASNVSEVYGLWNRGGGKPGKRKVDAEINEY
jgi:uncharacterized membrane-anchored protein YitT (DUF2179 family)